MTYTWRNNTRTPHLADLQTQEELAHIIHLQARARRNTTATATIPARFHIEAERAYRDAMNAHPDNETEGLMRLAVFQREEDIARQARKAAA